MRPAPFSFPISSANGRTTPSFLDSRWEADDTARARYIVHAKHNTKWSRLCVDVCRAISRGGLACSLRQGCSLTRNGYLQTNGPGSPGEQTSTAFGISLRAIY